MMRGYRPWAEYAPFGTRDPSDFDDPYWDEDDDEDDEEEEPEDDDI